jgi:integrase/recombinase XerD
MRAKEIAWLSWSMITDASGGLADAIAVPNRASKGKGGGRIIPMHLDLREALSALSSARPDKVRADRLVIYSERGRGLTPNAIATWFGDVYRELGIEGASSHSGRRTFITNAAEKIIEAGGSLRDVQELAGHADLNMTARYIAGDTAAKRKVIEML